MVGWSRLRAVALARRSQPGKPDPDLFLMALLARFRGYYPGYSRDIVDHHDYLSWSVLKAHTANRAGTDRVTAVATNPLTHERCSAALSYPA